MSILEKVKELREITGAGMQDCKSALKENNEDIEKSIEYLRKKGILKAAKKSSRDAAEGLIIVGNDDEYSTLTEINSETDFVAKNEEFISFCKKISDLSTKVNSLDEIKSFKLDSLTVDEYLVNLVAKIGENIKIRRFKKIKKDDNKIKDYIHNKVSDECGKIGVLLKYKSSSSQSEILAKNICMHIAALSPMSLDSNSLDKTFIKKEKKIIEDQIEKNKKPEILEKIISGKLNKIISDNVLLDQKFVVDPDLSVNDHIKDFNKKNNDNFQIKEFLRFKVGEGVEIKKSDFSDEVKNLIQ
jgi:elongation factor Ts